MAREGPQRPHQDTIAGIVLLLFCALAFWLTTRFESLPAMLSQNVPPTFFPRIVVGLISLCSIALIVDGLKRTPEQRDTVKHSVLLSGGLIVLMPVSVWLIGSLPSISLFSIALPLLWGERRLHLPLLLAISLPAAVYLVFTLALGVRFPLGLVASWVS